MCRCLRLNKFLCFNLETGGVVIGFVHILFAALGVIISVKEIVELLGQSCHANDCKLDKNVLIGIHLAFDVTCIVWAYFSFKVVEATKRRKHDLLRPIRIMLIIFTIVAFSLFILFAALKQRVKLVYNSLRCLLFGCMNLYSILVINSIYNNFKEEFDAYQSRLVNDRRISSEMVDIDIDAESALSRVSGLSK